jgi:outer membrane lipoprotein-sorting protein
MINLTRRHALLSAALAALPTAVLAQAGALSAEDRALVASATGYLQSLNEARGRFTQTDARGAVTRGELFLKRPGKARFAYDPPSGLLVVSDGTNVNIHNAKLKTFDAYPLMATPLSLFLAREIKLDRGVRIARVSRQTGGFSITARDGKKQAEGQITLDFSDSPLALLGWTVTDAQGASTRVRISGLTKVAGLAPSLFVLKNPRPQNPGRARM